MIDLQQPATDLAAAIAASAPGVRISTDAPPNQISVFPFVDVYLASFTISYSKIVGGSVVCICKYHADLHLSGNDAPRDAKALTGLATLITNGIGQYVKGISVAALQSIQAIGDTEVTLSVFQGGAGQGTNTVGYRFAVTVKVQGAITS